MRHIHIIGIGSGNPDHLTLEAVKTIGASDIVFIPTKGEDKADLADLRRQICAQHLGDGARIVEFALPRRDSDPDYRGTVDRWHGAIAERYEQLFHAMADDDRAAFLVWGDPSLYDSTIRIVERVLARGAVAFDFDVIPGITSLQVLAARHRIPLNLVGDPVEITTGRRLARDGLQGRSTAVMLDGEQAFAKLEEPEAEIFWGAYLGMENEITLSGQLSQVADEICARRAEARERHGWIMDIYLIRKGRDFD